jgi:hypothetical protein
MSRTGIATYSGDPTTSPLDEVRFLVGDTGPIFDLNNAEINYQFRIIYGNPLPPGSPPPQGNFLAAAYCADAIATEYKKLVDKTVGDLQISYSQMAKNFGDIAIRLRSRATLSGVKTYAGGLSLAQKRANDLNRDLVSTAVKVDGMDYAQPLQNQTGAGSGPETTGEVE